MNKYLVNLFLLTASTTTASTSIMAASFPHTSAIYQTTMSGPMMKVTTDAYVYFDGDEAKAISAEWVTQESPAGKTHKLNITKNSIIYAVDLDKRHCTKTNIKSLTDSISDPEAFAKSMKQQMGLKENGTCEGAGLKGTKLTSSFSEMCMYKDVFMVWMNAMGTKTEVTNVKFDVDLPKDKISVPAGIKCVEGPDIAQGLQGMQMPNGTSSGKTYDRSQQQSPPGMKEQGMENQDMEEAMKKAQEAMKSFGDMFNQQ